MKKWLQRIVILLVPLVLLAIGVKYCMHSITPQEMTSTIIGGTFNRIYLYGRKNHKIPVSLDILPDREGYLNQKTDAWGREIVMEIKHGKIITLISFGKDGKPGGVGENSDISQSYWLTKPDGSLWIDDKDWIYDARVWKE